MGAVSSAPRLADSLTTMPRRTRRSPPPRYGARPHSHGSFSRGGPVASPGATFQIPGIRCYQCHAIFHSRADLARQTHHCRCPYCSAINGVPAAADDSARADASTSALAAAINAASNPRSLASLESNQREQLLRRLQSRDISPLELLILQEFVEHLQQNRHGANLREIDQQTAAWTVDDVKKLPEELRTCCVCLDEVCEGSRVRTLPCLHTFHAACAEEWLTKKKTCPLCQFAIDGAADLGEVEEED